MYGFSFLFFIFLLRAYFVCLCVIAVFGLILDLQFWVISILLLYSSWSLCTSEGWKYTSPPHRRYEFILSEVFSLVKVRFFFQFFSSDNLGFCQKWIFFFPLFCFFIYPFCLFLWVTLFIDKNDVFLPSFPLFLFLPFCDALVLNPVSLCSGLSNLHFLE